MKVLIAEDDLTSRKMLESLLQKWGYDVCATSNGKHAWEILEQSDSPHLLIIDWLMPELDGLSLCRRIREKFSDYYTYIILQTTKDCSEDKKYGFKAGVDDYLVKPFDNLELYHKVNVGSRVITYEYKINESRKSIQKYAQQMESLAQQRAKQLVHTDRMATLGVLSAGLAHEINNPTSFISGNAQLIEKAWRIINEKIGNEVNENEDETFKMVCDEFPDMIDGIKKGVDRITSIINGLKGYARHGSTNKESFTISHVIEEALQLCQTALKYNVKVTVDCEYDSTVSGDKQQIEQVLVNLILNAVHAMENNEESFLTIKAEKKEKYVSVSVTDNGIGVSKKVINKLFDPFFTTKEAGKGTGLGLSISNNIIIEHGGELKCIPMEKGACFNFTLPTNSKK
ncbi:response regulator [Chitinispirillales bacterium ANBcel5]|uniref:hybrid sensor histidine kinase/response regulator n=1 Tax=Cellulosispirillum alkaliphilum TaxID=3039283 RepID=UPI002A54B5AD|nr:response regulator [Chitinispirillales bacterium ANBcel5]